jgi:uncharacterized protein
MRKANASAESGRVADVGFHDGELAVQRRAGTRDEAARLSGMLEPAELRGGIVTFLAQRRYAVITGRDANGRLWNSPLTGSAGFLEAVSPDTLAIHARPREGDPLHGLPVGQPVGLIAVEFATRRRVRVNGTLTSAGSQGLSIEVEQAFGNCPQYIHPRDLGPGLLGQGESGDVRQAAELSAADVALIRAADTFFLGTTNSGRGSDSSHRGGPPGFVRVDGGRLWWPDYPGNNMFNSFGNLAVDPEAALLFLDFGTGRALHLSGTAEVEWDAAGRPADDGGTGRRVVFTLQRVVSA